MLPPFEAHLVDYLAHPMLGHILLFQLDCHPDQLPLLQSCPIPTVIARGPWGDRSVEVTSLRWPADQSKPVALSTPTDLDWRLCETLVLLFQQP